MKTNHPPSIMKTMKKNCCIILIRNTILLISIFYLLACSNNKKTELKLVQWDNGFLPISEVNFTVMADQTALNGKDKLRNILLKQSFLKIFTKEAMLHNIIDSIEFQNEYIKIKEKVLSRALIADVTKGIKKITDQDVKVYFLNNIEDYTAAPLYSIYVYNMSCESKIVCKVKLKTQLQNSTFKQLVGTSGSSLSGYYQSILLKKLNKTIQSEIKNIKLQEISEPIKLNNNSFIFLKVTGITPEKQPSLKVFAASIRQNIKNDRIKRKLDELQKTILLANPSFKKLSQEELFANYAISLNFHKKEKVIKRLQQKYKWLVADYGYYSSFVFDNLNINILHKKVLDSPNMLKRLTRFDIQVVKREIRGDAAEQNINISHKLANNDLTGMENEILNYQQLSKIDFNKEFKGLGIDPFKLTLNQWSNPKIVDTSIWWFNKTYQGIAKDDAQFVSDYKKFQRYMLGSYSGFMSKTGKALNVTINPIIYSEQWREIANEFID